MKKITISGYYGFDNVGDEVILESLLQVLYNIASLKKQSIQVTVLSANPQKTEGSKKVNAVKRTNMFGILQAIYKCNFFISGGGGLLQDKTGRGLSVLYYTMLIFFAFLMRKPTVLYAHSIGPVDRKINRLLIKFVLNKASFITVRDSASKEKLISWGVNKTSIYKTADSVFFLKKYVNSKNRKPQPPLVGISIKKTLHKKELEKEIVSTANYLTKELGARIIFIPMHPEKDLQLSEEFSKKIPGSSVAKESFDYERIFKLYSQLDFLIGMRLHSLIFATLTETPFVGIVCEHEPKTHSYLKEIDIKPVNFLKESLLPKCKVLINNNTDTKEKLYRASWDFHREIIECSNNVFGELL